MHCEKIRSALALNQAIRAKQIKHYGSYDYRIDRLCALVVGVPDYISRGTGSIPGATRFSEKYWVWNGVHLASWVQLRSYSKEKVGASV
jgi:hypothetical protein